MAIKRNRQIRASQALPRLGWIHKGIHVGHPLDTDRFWISFDPSVVADPDAVMAAWRSLYGLEPFAHLNDKALKEALKNPEHNFAPRYLNNVYVISNQFDDDDSYRSFFEKHVKTPSNKRIMTRRCTGESIVAEMRQDAFGIYDRTHKTCPRVAAEAASKDPNKACDCKLEGHLRLIIPALLDAANLPHGYFELETSAWRDDANIYTALGYTQQNWGDNYGVPLSQIPFTIWREGTEYSYLDGNAKAAKKFEFVIRMAATDEYMASIRNQKPIVLVRQVADLKEEGAALDEIEEFTPVEETGEPDDGPAGDASEVTLSPEEKLVSDLDKNSYRYLGFSGESLVNRLGFKTYKDLFAQFPTWDVICGAVTKLLVETETPVRVYGIRTVENTPSSVKYLLNFGFNIVYAYSRDEFKIPGYSKDEDYTSMTRGKAVQLNLRFLGDHFVSEVFKLNHLLVQLKLNGNNELDIAEIRDPSAMPF